MMAESATWNLNLPNTYNLYIVIAHVMKLTDLYGYNMTSTENRWTYTKY